MALSQLDVQAKLVAILGTNHVYFQPPESVKMVYPAIVYSRNNLDKKNADNITYIKTRLYRVTYIAYEPESSVLDALEDLPTSRFMAHSVIDNLNQDTFEIYF